jgi:hypothetical protein
VAVLFKTAIAGCTRFVAQVKGTFMTDTLETRTISVSIRRDWREVYDFAHRPENFARWASGAAKTLRREGADWVADGPEGRAVLRFTERNDFGVLDHTVILAGGAEIHVPLRAVANGRGCEVMLTLFRQPGMTDEVFARDADWIAKDLNRLKALLESL